jgi:hypothetical protein
MMRISFLALLLLAVIGTPNLAEAADLEILKAPTLVTPSPRWNGFYVGMRWRFGAIEPNPHR